MKTRLNILHVDDSHAVILYTKIMLMEISLINSIDPARTVSAARQALATKFFEVVILDINLPDGNGIDLLKWVKRNYPQKVTIMFTNSSDEFFRREAEKAGVDHFLDKSMEFEDLLEILKTIKLTPAPVYEAKM